MSMNGSPLAVDASSMRVAIGAQPIITVPLANGKVPSLHFLHSNYRNSRRSNITLRHLTWNPHFSLFHRLKALELTNSTDAASLSNRAKKEAVDKLQKLQDQVAGLLAQLAK